MATVPRGTLVCIQSSGNPFTDFITRVLSGAGVVHCGIALGDGTMINARGSGGVQISNVTEGHELFAKMPDNLVEPVIAMCQSVLGKKYDFLHLLAGPIWNVFHIDIGCSVPNKFICSTLLAWAIRKCWLEANPGGAIPTIPLFTKPLSTITPQDILNSFPQFTIFH